MPRRNAAAFRRAALWTVLLGLLGAGLAVAFWPRPIPVDLAAVRSGPMVVTVDAEAETRVRDVFTLSAPVAGRLQRIELDPGDGVQADLTEVARIEPVDPGFLDVRTEAQSQAAVRAAEAALALAEAELARAEADRDFAESDLRRLATLFERQAVSERAYDEAERRARAERAAVATARAAVQVKAFELERARAALMTPSAAQEQRAGCDCVPVRSPVSGRVLRVLREDEGVVQAGAPLVEIGDLATLEIVADLLSSDAVKVEAGQRVLVEAWGGAGALNGVVRRVEPFGFTEVSALGVEEQRVNVVIDLSDAPERWARLGHGYRVEVGIVLSEGEALQAPLGALFRRAEDWALFAVEDGRAVERAVEIGRRTALAAEIVNGAAAGDVLILNPGDRIGDGVAVTERRVE
ncbi:MAG: HlyD family efflux transporter periplasmic adaptor subunit [Alphaproteobacteria bacterium]|nr:HlyD family efflux transporter periplasmic adaptor subunit [Alphaproteobacteria bacterium]